MSEREIQHRLFWDTLSSSEFTMPNFTPRNWFECDFFRITKAQYFYEYEIKMTVSDFRADRQKSDYVRDRANYVTKHQQIIERLRGCPSRFYYVVPEAIAEKVHAELPEWAGLIVWHRHLACKKQAPILHRNKISRGVVRQARQSMAGRYWDLYLTQPLYRKIANLEYDLAQAMEAKAG